MYYLATWLRNKMYDLGIKSSTTYDVPVICVGNLSIGGTGKTPMIEYLIRLLKEDYKIATLSRGYKRKTHGFAIVDKTMNASIVGDEPFQLFKKFDDIVVSVDTNRRHGIDQLLALDHKPEVILLDDAFQHRRVKAGFNILLTSFNSLYCDDIVLPTGNLREPKSGVSRANVIVVTKCPKSISEIDKQQIADKLKPLGHQRVFFGSIVYSDKIKNLLGEQELKYLKGKTFTLVTGIADSKPLVDFLYNKGLSFEHLNFKDHHEFSEKEVEQLKLKDLIVTTEKDFVRLEPYFRNSDKVFYLPIKTVLYNSKAFNGLITNFVASF
jgi:tetraacyldisaccharide 4'-kinase